MTGIKSFTCPKCNHRIESRKAWLLTHKSLLKSANCNCMLRPEKSTTRLIAMLIAMNCSAWVVMIGYKSMTASGFLVSLIYALFIGGVSLVLLYFSNKIFVKFHLDNSEGNKALNSESNQALL